MLNVIRDLLIVQERDRHLLDLAQRLDALPRDEARARQRLEHDQQAVAAAKEAMQQKGVSIQQLELEIETRQTTIGRLKTQQFETRKNDEFRALGHEIERYAAEIDELETRQLEALEAADTLQQRLSEAQAALARSEQVVEDDLEALAQRRKNLEADRLDTTHRRDEALAAVDPEPRDLYQRLLRKKDGLAIAEVRAGQCGGCHVKLIPATLIRVQAGSEIVQCENCGRMLYST